MKLEIDIEELVLRQYAKQDESPEITEIKNKLKILHKMIKRKLRLNEQQINKYLELLLKLSMIQQQEIINLTYKLIKDLNL